MQGQQPNFYNDQTSGGYYLPPPPPPPPSLWQRYRAARKRTQWGIGCFTLIALCILSNIMGTLASPNTQQQAQQNQQAIATVTPTIANSTQTPIATPTAKPSPTPTATQKPTQVPTKPPIPTPTPIPVHTGVNGNPWGYDFSPGSFIYNPNANFCSYFACIASFWNGHGYVEECQDGDYSKSGGISGSCSRHGGNLRPLYSH